MNISLSLSLPRKNGLRLNFEYAAVSGLEEKQARLFANVEQANY